MHLRLSIQHPTDGEREYSTQEPTVEIGRDPKATLSLADGRGTVSWRHARIDLTGGAARIEDLGSTNGTYVNGRRLDKGQPAPLHVKDIIQFGQKGPCLHVRELDLSAQSIDATVLTPAPLAAEPARAPVYPARNGSPAPVVGKRPPATSQSGPTTRLMLAQTQQHFRRFTIVAVLCGVAGVAVVLLAVAIAVIALLHNSGTKTMTDEPTANKDSDGNKEIKASTEEVFQRTVKSTAYIRIHYKAGNQSMISMGSGVLIDRDQRLVATAYHVVHGHKDIPVIFPKYAAGRLLTNEEDYAPNGSLKDFIIGAVWASDPERDLAIVQLPVVPLEVPELKLAADSPAPGAAVHAVGGKPQGNTSLWVYSHGYVRDVEETTVVAGTQTIRAWMVTTQNPINHGNSGGPLVNDRCEVVGICSNADLKATNVTRFIDVRHVKSMLKEKPQKVLPGGK
jgi:pSer/pThr/pTyr-binding forkhead associated (FHA) protein